VTRSNAPTINNDLAFFCVERSDNPLTGKLTQYLWGRRSAEDNFLRTIIEPKLTSFDRSDTAPNPAATPRHQLQDQPLVISLSERSI
jgi:hypothetical protein